MRYISSILVVVLAPLIVLARPAETVPDVTQEDISRVIKCIGMRCTYRLINPAKFSRSDLREAATQAVTGLQHRRLNQSNAWIGPGSGVSENEEVAFWAKTPEKLEQLKFAIVSLDRHYNAVNPTPVRLITQVYVVAEEALNDFGVGISGFFNGGEYAQNTVAGGLFGPALGGVTGYVGGLTSSLLRFVFNAAAEDGRAVRLVDRPKIFYSGKHFSIEDKTPWYRDGTISTEKDEAGFELTGVVYVDTKDPTVVAVDNLSISLGLLPSDEERVDAKTGTGVRQLQIPNEYEVLNDGKPKILYDAVVFTDFKDTSVGLYTGSRSGGEKSRLLVILTAEVDPKDKGEIPHETTQEPLDVLREDLSPKKPFHAKEEKEESGSEPFDILNLDY